MRTLVNGIQERIRTVEGRERFNTLLCRFLPSQLEGTAEANDLLRILRTNGNVPIPPLATIAELEELRRDLEQRLCYDPWQRNIGTFKVADTPPATNNARIIGVQESPIARRIANSPMILDIVSGYLGCRPTIDDIIAWWSLPGRPLPKEEQFFHRDRDAAKFLKLFVYLSDVGPEDGAHVFVQESHRKDVLLERRRRYLDEEVFAALPAENASLMTGPMGTTFIEDTYGLHKGGVPTDQSRLVLQVRYTSYPSNWTPRRASDEVAALADEFDPYVNRFVA